MRVFRHNLSGGVLGEDLHYRSDLEAYHKGNLVQENFLPTPYGGVMRRPPSEKLIEHGTETVNNVVYSPAVIRYFDFVYDRDARYVVALIAYTADGHDSISRLKIFDTDGTLKDTVACVYAALNIFELCPRQLNDVMYLSHNGYPLRKLVRNADTDWTLEDAEMKGGPWLPWNTDEITLSVEKEAYTAADTYAAGEVLHSGAGDISVTAASYVLWYTKTSGSVTWYYYFLRLTIGSHTLKARDTVQVSGFQGESSPINGSYTIQRVGATYIDINTGRFLTTAAGGVWTNDYPLPSAFTTERVGSTVGDRFFLSLKDENLNNALPVAPAFETEWWRQTSAPGRMIMKSSDDLFSADMVGQKIYCTIKEAQSYSGIFDATGEFSDNFAYASGPVTLKTVGGVWGGTIELQKSLDGGATWEVIGSIIGADGNNNGSITRDIDEPEAIIRAYMLGYTAIGTGQNCKWQIEFPAGTPFIGTIAVYVNARTVYVDPETALTGLFQTKSWKLGAFSETNGYPGVVTIHDERLVLGGSKLQPFMVWCSAVNNWEWFADGVLETSPLAIQANADRATRLCWMASKGELLFGTDFNEYSAGSRDSDKIISGVNPPKVQVQNSYSSAPIQSLMVGEDLIFVQSDKKTLRSMAFSDAKWGYAGTNLTISCPDIAGNGFKWLTVQRNPFPVIWAGTDDDVLISFTYDKEMNITGWARHPMAGATVVSGCVIPGEGSDTLFLCTLRSGVYQMERLSYDNQVFTDDQDGTDRAMVSLIQPTNMAQGPNVLEEARYRITRVFLYLKESHGGEVSVDEGVSWTDIRYPSEALFTGKVEINVNSGSTEKAPLMIRASGTQPFNLLSVGMDIDRQSTKE